MGCERGGGSFGYAALRMTEYWVRKNHGITGCGKSREI
jgi:hypothetical protein